MKKQKLDENHDLYVFSTENKRRAQSMVARFVRWNRDDCYLYGEYEATQQGKYVCIIDRGSPCMTPFLSFQKLPPVKDSDAQPVNTFDDILKHLAIAELIAAVMKFPLENAIKAKIKKTLVDAEHS